MSHLLNVLFFIRCKFYLLGKYFVQCRMATTNILTVHFYRIQFVFVSFTTISLDFKAKRKIMKIKCKMHWAAKNSS